MRDIKPLHLFTNVRRGLHRGCEVQGAVWRAWNSPSPADGGESFSLCSRCAESVVLDLHSLLIALRFDAFPSSDQPSRVQHCGSDLPHPHLQLLPQRFLGGSGQEAVCWGADLPLEAQNHQEWLREAGEQRESKGSDCICGETEYKGELL